MDQTINRRYPYPECDPPLQQDASDIIQLAQLADAINSDVQQLSDTIEAQMAYPPSARMTAAFTTTASEIVFDYGVTSWETRAGMTSPGLGVFTIQQPGWYLVTGYVSAPALHMRIRLVVNDEQRGVWQGYSRPQTGVANQVQELSTSLFLDAGDTLTSVLRHASTGTISFTGQLAIVSVVSGA